MATRVSLIHRTTYTYVRPVFLGPHIIRLRPAPHCRTAIPAYSLRVEPKGAFVNWQQDPFGNWQARVMFPKPSRTLSVEVNLLADLVPQNSFDFFIAEHAEHYPFDYEPQLAAELLPFCARLAGGKAWQAFVTQLTEAVVKPGQRVVDLLVGINQFVNAKLRYDIRMEPGVFTPDETLDRGHGSCRDFAWLMVQALRHLGIAARFVSGYSIQLMPDVAEAEGKGVREDCADLHAWAEAYLPGAGWIGLDATSGLLAGEGHIPLACAAEPVNAAPVTGSFSLTRDDDGDNGGVDRRADSFRFSMQVERVEERPRPARSYTAEQERAIHAAGLAVDRVLEEGGVRLTMGGEPTFVSAVDREGDEWNTTAVSGGAGSKKAAVADRLLRRLSARFAPGGLLHHGQGKWYPGETLPRWAYSCYFRSDGEPLWTDDALIADGRGLENATSAKAELFVRQLAARLDVDPEYVTPGFEDVWYYLWRERRLPLNVDPFESRLDDEQERARLRQVFDQGLTHPVGYALPVQAIYDGDNRYRWASGRWHFRDARLYLLPGDSPMGLRLARDSLPWSEPADSPALHQGDPMAPRPPLPKRGDRRLVDQAETPAPPPRLSGVPDGVPARGVSAKGVVRTALCVEARGGTLHVFLPPLGTAEEFVDLVSHIEDTARALRQPVRLEGYHPPSDHRLKKFQVTPDPGVIEVNIHPAASWPEIADRTRILYEEARACELTAEKFLIDGRHTGTGGGNHVTLGGATPADSPLLRRPDLLRSLLSYFLDHPSLSYLFSGLFVGPTSQAPRLDEARHDALEELDIALGRIPSPGAGTPPQPWLVDRLLRHLLVDVTGNTHRAEFCIDKLFSPDGAAGRLGLLELRGFEMPPDPGMSLAQQLLVRALVARMWLTPHTRRPIRWGTTLHDRFMLPHFVAADLADVIADLNAAGLPLRQDFFNAHFEFRFPALGHTVIDGVTLDLRQAIEPWPVLGEEAGAGGNVRYVDSSVDRVQITVRGATDSRHVVVCNGRRVPLAPTQTQGTLVAGVRFKAWQPPSGLHPTIEPHVPLIFELFDLWKDRSLGGCTYHTAHPGGRSFDTLPKNALEAESRRASRFQTIGYRAGVPLPPEEPIDPRFPLTLDLRRSGPV